MNAPTKDDVLAELRRNGERVPEEYRAAWIEGGTMAIHQLELIAVTQRGMTADQRLVFFEAYLARVSSAVTAIFGVEDGLAAIDSARRAAVTCGEHAEQRGRFNA